MLQPQLCQACKLLYHLWHGLDPVHHTTKLLLLLMNGLVLYATAISSIYMASKDAALES
jgi:hypothetical protein